MNEHQVIIVGAGPAGSACAKALKEGSTALDVYKERTADLMAHVNLCREKMNLIAVAP